MGDEDKSTEPSLELPKLFGRKKRRPASSSEVAPAQTPAEAAADEATHDDTQVVEESDDTTQVIEQPEPQTVPAAAPPPPPAEEKRPLFADEAPAVLKPVKPPKPVKAPKPAKADKPPKPPKPLAEDREPIVTGRVAAALTGLLVGAAMVGATAASLKACEAVQGTATCGAAGFPILLAIVVAAVVIGSALLRAFRVPDPGSTSFLAVGSLAVIALLVFIDVLDRWWMILVIPLLGVATYLLSHWVTTTFIDAPED